MVSRRTLAWLCVLVLSAFAVFPAVSHVRPSASSQSSISAQYSSGAQVVVADGGRPQPPPIPFPRGGMKTVVADGRSPQPKPIPFSASRGGLHTLVADGGRPQPAPIPFSKSREVLPA